MTKPILDSKHYLFTKDSVTVYLTINCLNNLYTVGVNGNALEYAFTSTDNFEANITVAELILEAVKFAKDELSPEFESAKFSPKIT